MMLDLPNKEIRELVEEHLRDSDDTMHQIAKRIGWYKNSKRRDGDETRLRRALGISIQPASYRTRIHRATAIKIINAIGADPVDIDGL